VRVLSALALDSIKGISKKMNKACCPTGAGLFFFVELVVSDGSSKNFLNAGPD
jgi:hypothetical protein